jgi:hypothetical protein
LLAILALPAAALADGAGPSARATVLALPADSPLETEAPLPTRLGAWDVDEMELRDAHLIDFLPQGRLSQKGPFIDFSKFEMGGYAGVVDYSSDFLADASFVAGISARVPVPGLPLGDWGVWAQLHLSYIRRDIPFYYKNASGEWLGVSVGGDYTFVRDEIWYLRAQLGVMYAHWMDVQALDNGMGVLAGLQFGFFWIKGYNKATVTLTPQLSYDGDNYVGFFTVGFSVDF